MTTGELPAYQGRSRASRDKIVAALDDLLREKPFEQLTVAELAKKAGVAVGTVYQRFKNKEALLPVVFQIYLKRLDEWRSGPARIEIEDDDDLRTALRKVFRQAWKIIRKEAHLLRTVHLQTRLKPEIAENTQWKTFEKASAASIRAIVEYFEKEVRRENIDRAIDFTTYYFNSIMIEKGLYPEEPPAIFFKQKGTAFADECADMLYGYLTLK